MIESCAMSLASDFAGKTPRITDLDALRRQDAEEISGSIWRFPDGSMLKAQWSAGVNCPSGFILILVGNQATASESSDA